MEPYFASVAPGLESVLARELQDLGARVVHVGSRGVAFAGALATAYRVCLWSRVAGRVVLPLAQARIADAEDLYEVAAALPWEDHLPPGATFAVDVGGAHEGVRHSGYAALKLKDAIVDRLRARRGARPDVDKDAPDVRVHLRLRRASCVVAIDLSGRPLHERGYRGAQGVAPLKETLAAGCLLAWDEFGELRAAAARGEPVWLADPLCGSGTFLLEAGSILADLAPGRLRDAVDSTRRWGFVAWGGHDPTAWAALQREAEERAVAGLARLTGRLRLFGSDSGAIVREVRPGAVRLGLDVFVSTARRDLGDLYLGGDGEQPAGDGLVVTNPPYGARLGDVAGAEAVLRRLGAALRRRCPGRRVAVLAARGTERALDLPLDGATTVWNGALECRFVRAHVPEQGDTRRPASGVRNDELEAFRNRIAKNLGKLERWIAREGVEAYRLYDADIPQLAVAVDRYGDRVQIHEYEPPARVDPVRARERLAAITDALPALLGVSAAHVHVKVRRRQRQAAGEQYERLGAGGEEFAVREGPLRFLVNLTDRLDTGLYLDHRTTRRMVGELASGKRLLNLFGYTATATAQAIASGASATTTVDSSWTYLEWGQRNLALNRLVPSAPAAGTPHELVRADCLQWLQRTRDAWDVVFLDPPTHSRGALMAGPFDVQLDHPALLRLVRPRIAPGGVLVFSTHARGFRLGGELGDWARVEEVTHRTIPPDFRLAPRSAAVHRCFLLHAPA